MDGLSGTVVQRANLGIPEIPGMGGEDSSELSSLISGTHTLRVRYSGEDKARLAVLGTYGETDVILNGTDLWIWSSRDQAATHRTIDPGSRPDRTDKLPADLPKTPQEAAEQVLAALEPTTTVSTDSAVTVADRAAYELVLDPNDDSTLISQVRIAIDGDTKMPLRVQVFGGDGVTGLRGRLRPGQLHPPGRPGVRVQPAAGDQGHRGRAGHAAERRPPRSARQVQQEAEDAREQVKIVGHRLEHRRGQRGRRTTRAAAARHSCRPSSASCRSVQGDWGSGRLLPGTAFSAVLTDDGRIAVGAVRPEKLYEALAR